MKPESSRWKANVTVAAVIETENKFLMIEEDADGLIVINQPAGHLPFVAFRALICEENINRHAESGME